MVEDLISNHPERAASMLQQAFKLRQRMERPEFDLEQDSLEAVLDIPLEDIDFLKEQGLDSIRLLRRATYAELKKLGLRHRSALHTILQVRTYYMIFKK